MNTKVVANPDFPFVHNTWSMDNFPTHVRSFVMSFHLYQINTANRIKNLGVERIIRAIIILPYIMPFECTRTAKWACIFFVISIMRTSQVCRFQR